MSGSRSGCGFGDQLAEQAAAFWPVVDPGDLLLVQAHRDELGQPAALADDPERAVPGVDEGDRGLDDLAENDLQLKVAADATTASSSACTRSRVLTAALSLTCSSASRSSRRSCGSNGLP